MTGNATLLEGILAAPVVIRVTPSGLATATLEVEHDSQIDGFAPLQEFKVRMTVLALGPLAEPCRGMQTGSRLLVEGALNQKRWIREGQVRWGRIELVARKIIPLPPLAPPAESDAGSTE